MIPYGNGKKGEERHSTTKVGSFEPNRLGLYDLQGNVWEWCDELDDAGPARVFRGDSWNNNGSNYQTSNRNRNEPANRNNNLGMRLARDPPAGRRRSMPVPVGPVRLASTRM